MAQKKAVKPTVKVKTAQKKTTASKKQNTQKAKQSKQNAQPSEKQLQARQQKTAVIMVFSAIILLFLTLIQGENVWEAVHNFVFGVFGICSYIIPLFLIYIAVIVAMDKPEGFIKTQAIGISSAILVAEALVHVFSQFCESGNIGMQINAVWSSRNDISFENGGFFGAVIGGTFRVLCGRLAAEILLIIIFILIIMLLTGTSLIKIYKFFAAPVKKAEDLRDKRREERENSNEAVLDEEYEKAMREKAQHNKKFTPIDIGPDPVPQVDEAAKDDSMFIEELVGNSPEADHENSSIEDIIKNTEANEEKNNEKSEDSSNEKVEQIIKDLKSKTESKKEKEKAPNKQVSADNIVEMFKAEYRKPGLNCLMLADNSATENYQEELRVNAKKLVDTLNSFGVSTKITEICRGPSVTRYEIQPAPGVKISKITGLSDDIALALASSGVRIEAPIPNKSAVGIELPNKKRATVSLREIIETGVYKSATEKSKLNVAMGKNITGDTICADIAKMPHLLIAGTTGSGKSVCLNAMIISLLFNANPDEVKLLMIDPKQVEFTVYNGIPHLLVPVVSDPRKAAGALGWAVTEMLQRYKMFSEKNVRDIKGYNKLADKSDDINRMPHVVIFIDELSDLMMAAPNEVEDSICRLAQMARAAGMHLVIATQRPSVNVITGIIKANIPSRIALSVSSQVDSRTIIDTAGAEKLLGNGDMLFSPVGMSKPVRVQGCFVSDSEVEAVVNFIKDQETVKYDENVISEIERQAAAETNKKKLVSGSDDDSSGDEMMPSAIEVVVEAQMASTTLLQRKLKLGYARAARLMDTLEEKGIVGPFEGSKPRKVLITKQQWMEMNALANASPSRETPYESESAAIIEENGE